MKIFISSVRRGLEEERDALPALILALGHSPIRFEDFGARPVPSREACLRGVEEAEVYILLLGATYGDPLPDTGAAPTEEEWTLARRRGIPVLAFRKEDQSPEPRQATFITRVEEYRTGLFRESFRGALDLLPKVAAAIRGIESQRPALRWRRLPAPVPVPWEDAGRIRTYGSSTVLECHIIPVGAPNVMAATVLAELPRRLTRAGRENGLFGEERAIEAGMREGQAWAIAQPDRDRLSAGIRVTSDGAIALWTQLRSDSLGAILDQSDLVVRIGGLLRLASDLAVCGSDEVAVAVGLQGLAFAAEGNLADLGRRSSVSVGLRQSDDFARVEARDALTSAALGGAIDDVARELATRLMLRFREVRR